MNKHFVWVPCHVTGGINTSATYSTEYKRTDFGYYKDESFSNYSETLDTNDSNSIKTYGGFYIGRYEAGADNEVTSNDITRRVLFKRNKYPYNYVTIDNSKTKSQNFANDNNYDTNKIYTKLVSSYAWDTALCFIQKTVTDYATNSKQGFYKDNIQGGSYFEFHKFNTGLSTSVCNIYDMGGNVNEFSSEVSSFSEVVVRGGNTTRAHDETPAGWRAYISPWEIEAGAGLGPGAGFRITLYLK